MVEILMLALAVLIVPFLLIPAFKELRHVRRRLALRRELDAACGGSVFADPGRRVVPAVGTSRAAAYRASRNVSPLHAVRAEVVGVAAPAGPTLFSLKLAAFKAELADRGEALDDLRVE